MRNKTILWLLLALLALSACSRTGNNVSSDSSVTSQALTTTTVSSETAGQEYLKLAGVVNPIAAAFSAKAVNWTNSTTDSQALSDATPLMNALKRFDTQAENYTWPSTSVTDIHALISDTGAIIGDLQGLASLDALNMSTWESTLARDAADDKTQANLVRSDLGLTANVGSHML